MQLKQKLQSAVYVHCTRRGMKHICGHGKHNGFGDSLQVMRVVLKRAIESYLQGIIN
jgi:hypothetical protein